MIRGKKLKVNYKSKKAKVNYKGNGKKPRVNYKSKKKIACRNIFLRALVAGTSYSLHTTVKQYGQPKFHQCDCSLCQILR